MQLLLFVSRLAAIICAVIWRLYNQDEFNWMAGINVFCSIHDCASSLLLTKVIQNFLLEVIISIISVPFFPEIGYQATDVPPGTWRYERVVNKKLISKYTLSSLLAMQSVFWYVRSIGLQNSNRRCTLLCITPYSPRRELENKSRHFIFFMQVRQTSFDIFLI